MPAEWLMLVSLAYQVKAIKTEWAGALWESLEQVLAEGEIASDEDCFEGPLHPGHCPIVSKATLLRILPLPLACDPPFLGYDANALSLALAPERCPVLLASLRRRQFSALARRSSARSTGRCNSYRFEGRRPLTVAGLGFADTCPRGR